MITMTRINSSMSTLTRNTWVPDSWSFQMITCRGSKSPTPDHDDPEHRLMPHKFQKKTLISGNTEMNRAGMMLVTFWKRKSQPAVLLYAIWPDEFTSRKNNGKNRYTHGLPSTRHKITRKNIWKQVTILKKYGFWGVPPPWVETGLTHRVSDWAGS